MEDVNQAALADWWDGKEELLLQFVAAFSDLIGNKLVETVAPAEDRKSIDLWHPETNKKSKSNKNQKVIKGEKWRN